MGTPDAPARAVGPVRSRPCLRVEESAARGGFSFVLERRFAFLRRHCAPLLLVRSPESGWHAKTKFDQADQQSGGSQVAADQAIRAARRAIYPLWSRAATSFPVEKFGQWQNIEMDLNS